MKSFDNYKVSWRFTVWLFPFLILTFIYLFDSFYSSSLNDFGLVLNLSLVLSTAVFVFLTKELVGKMALLVFVLVSVFLLLMPLWVGLLNLILTPMLFVIAKAVV